MLGVLVQQRLDQRFCCPRLANRNDMQPEQGGFRIQGVEAVAFSNVLQILGLLARTPREPDPDQRLGKVEEQRVDQAVPW